MKTSCVGGFSFPTLVLAILCFLRHEIPALASCAPLPAGLVSWWRAEGNPQDASGTNNGALVGNASYSSGLVGSAFAFDGNGDGFNLGNPASLQFQDFSIEAWIKRASTSSVGRDGEAMFLSYGFGGYAFGMSGDGSLFLSVVGINKVSVTNSITDTSWHQVAVTKVGANVVFYLDSLAIPAAPYDSGFAFGSSVAIGARGDNLSASFLGLIDELAFYARALTAAEVQAIYTAASGGKCLFPVIYAPLADQTNFVGDTAIFSISAGGARPLAYQWFFNGNALDGATNSTFVFPSVQLTQAGNYSVTVSNGFGSADSSTGHLTVVPPPPCTPLGSNLVSWWRANGNALDSVSHNDGTLVGNTTYASGRAGPAFVFDGVGDAVQLGNPPLLQRQDFSIETWIRRASTSAVSGVAEAVFLGYGFGGYAFGMSGDGSLFLSVVGINKVSVTNSITDTSWHHVAVTKLGANVVFYLDSLAIPAAPYDSGFAFGSSVAIGARGDNLGASFLGLIDELAFYARALTAAEVQAIYVSNAGGKCPGAVAPFFFAVPASRTAFLGSSTTFSVTAAGSLPLSYQWRFSNTNLAGATNATLTLTNVQFDQLGNYSVGVSNAGGVSVSSNAQLAVIYSPAPVRVPSVTAISGGPITVPIQLVANGNENALTFSLNFDTQWLVFSSASVGSASANATLVPNTSQTNLGRLGVALVLPPGDLFSAGTQEVARVAFNAAIWLGATAAAIAVRFGDEPWPRRLADVQDAPLLADYFDGIVSLLATELEGDLTPRTNGNRVVNIADYAEAGRMASRLDLPAPGFEFQHADCAPLGTKGDGQIKVTDWVQVGRYFLGLDPVTAVGGPTTESPLTLSPTDGVRQVQIDNVPVVPGGAISIPLLLRAKGSENALGFSLVFDPTQLSYASVAVGNDAAGATIYANPTQTAAGRLGLALALPPGTSFAAGTREIARLNLNVNAAASGSSDVAFGDQPVPRAISDLAANELNASYISGGVNINLAPTLSISRAQSNVLLSWPTWAADFTLQSRTNAESGPWSNVGTTLQTNGTEVLAVQSIGGEARWFRLFHP